MNTANDLDRLCRGAMGSGVHFVNSLLSNDSCIHVETTNEYIVRPTQDSALFHLWEQNRWVHYNFASQTVNKLHDSQHNSQDVYQYGIVGDTERHQLLHFIKRRLAGVHRKQGCDDFAFPGWKFNHNIIKGMRDLRLMIAENFPSFSNFNIPGSHVGHYYINTHKQFNPTSFQSHVKDMLYQKGIHISYFEFKADGAKEVIEFGRSIPKSLEQFTNDIDSYHERNNQLIETFYEEFNW